MGIDFYLGDNCYDKINSNPSENDKNQRTKLSSRCFQTLMNKITNISNYKKKFGNFNENKAVYNDNDINKIFINNIQFRSRFIPNLAELIQNTKDVLGNNNIILI